MSRRLPPLFALKAFEATARLGSVTRAADELGRTHGAGQPSDPDASGPCRRPVVREVRHRSAVEPARRRPAAGGGPCARSTGAGMGPRAGRSAGTERACRLRATFAMRWLVPHLPGFYRKHPAVRVRLSMTSAREIRHQGADLVLARIVSHILNATRRRAIRIADVAFGPCAHRIIRPWSSAGVWRVRPGSRTNIRREPGLSGRTTAAFR